MKKGFNKRLFYFIAFWILLYTLVSLALTFFSLWQMEIRKEEINFWEQLLKGYVIFSGLLLIPVYQLYKIHKKK